MNRARDIIDPEYDVTRGRDVNRVDVDSRLLVRAEKLFNALLDHAHAVFICIGTAPQADGSADLSGIEAFAESMAPETRRPLVVAIKSTRPPVAIPPR